MSKVCMQTKVLEETKLDGCQVSCMIQIGDKLVIADNQKSQPEVKLFGAQCKKIDNLTLEPSVIKDMTKIKDNTFAVLNVVYRWFYFFGTKSSIILMEITQKETLKKHFNINFKVEITALHYADDSYFLASSNPTPCIEVYNLTQNELGLVKTISCKDLSCGLPTKMYVGDHKMIIADSTNQQVVICTYASFSGIVKNIKLQKFHALDIEPLPNGTILLATASNTSIVKLFPDANTADTNTIETGNFPCGLVYNNETGKLRVATKIQTNWDKIYLGWFKKVYKIQTYQCEFFKETDTIIDMKPTK